MTFTYLSFQTELKDHLVGEAYEILLYLETNPQYFSILYNRILNYIFLTKRLFNFI
jgi:hypothetical protein